MENIIRLGLSVYHLKSALKKKNYKFSTNAHEPSGAYDNVSDTDGTSVLVLVTIIISITGLIIITSIGNKN